MAKKIKTGGREKGTPNKSTVQFREFVQNILDSNMDRLQKDFALLEPKERWIIAEKLMQYSMPKMQSVQMDASVKNNNKTIFDKIFALSEEAGK